MSFPQVLGVRRLEALQNKTSFVVPLPFHIEDDDLLIIVFGQKLRFTPTTPSGWSVLFGPTNPGTDTVQLTGYYRIADGSEADGSTVTIAVGTSENAFAFSIRIGGSSGAPEAATASSTGSTTPNAPNLSPSWGTEDTLWIACGVWPINEYPSVLPTGYSNHQREARTTTLDILAPGSGSGPNTADNLAGAICRKEARASSDNPAAWTIASSVAWVAATLAVRGSVTPKEKFSVSWSD